VCRFYIVGSLIIVDDEEHFTWSNLDDQIAAKCIVLLQKVSVLGY